MLQIHRARGRFISRAEVLPWAVAIARRLLIDGVRRRRKERATVSLDTGGRDESPLDAAAPQHGVDELIHSRRLVRALEAELGRLPESHRAAFELIQNEGLSIREAAEVLGATPTAIKLRAHRAYVALRAALGDAFDRR
jgi:RNA polymerase sigma-70 factor (ECF subfamily)